MRRRSPLWALGVAFALGSMPVLAVGCNGKDEGSTINDSDTDTSNTGVTWDDSSAAGVTYAGPDESWTADPDSSWTTDPDSTTVMDDSTTWSSGVTYAGPDETWSTSDVSTGSSSGTDADTDTDTDTDAGTTGADSDAEATDGGTSDTN